MGLKKNKITSLLSNRIFFICIFVLIIPLVIYSIILYKHEYNAKIKDLFISINASLDNKTSLLNEKIKNNLNVLTYAGNEVNFNRSDTHKELEKIKEDFNINDIFYLKIKNSDFVCLYSTDENILNKSFLSSKGILNKSEEIFALDVNSICKACFYISHKIDNTSAIVTSVYLSDLIQKDDYPFNLAVIDQTGKVLASINKGSYLNLQVLEKDFYHTDKNYVIKKQLEDFGYYLVLEVPKSYIKSFHTKEFFIKHTLLFIIFVIIASFFVYFLIYILSKPLKNLIKIMNEIKQGNLSARYSISKLGFEVNYIGASFNEMLDVLLSEKKEKQSYLEELNLAKDIQYSMLFKDEIKNLDIAFEYIPAKHVGGDFYDVFRKDNKIFLLVLDAAGKGVDACLHSLNVRNTIRALALVLEDINEIIKKTNDLFMKDTKDYSFVTLFLACFDENTKELQYTSCGHLPALITRNNEIKELQTKGKALGIEKIEDIEIKTLSLQKDDVVMIYTDGVLDVKDSKGQFLGKKAFLELIKNTQVKNSKEILNTVFQKINNYAQNIEQYDDMTAIIFKI